MSSVNSATLVQPTAGEDATFHRLGHGVVAYTSTNASLTTPTPTFRFVTATPGFPSNNSAKQSSSLSPGAIAGIVMGTLTGLVILATISALLWIRKGRRHTVRRMSTIGSLNDSFAYDSEKAASTAKSLPKPHYVKARESKAVWGAPDIEKANAKDVEDDQMTLVNGVYVLNLPSKPK